MKLMLQLQSQIIEAEKNAEKSIHDAQVEKDAEVNKIKKEGNAKLEEGDVQVNELQEEIKSAKEIFREMSIYEIQVFEWGAQCADLQQKITKVKYDNQIEMAKMKQQIEAQYNESLDSFKQQANSDAMKSKLLHKKSLICLYRYR